MTNTLKFLGFAIFLLGLTNAGVLVKNSGKVKASLKPLLGSETHVNILISFLKGTKHVYSKLKAQSFESQDAQVNSLVKLLEQNAKESQHNVVSFLNENSLEVKSIWISNQLFVKSYPVDLIPTLEAFEEVSSIQDDFEILLDDPIDLKIEPTVSHKIGTFASSWGISTVKAVEAGEYLNSSLASLPEIRVAVVDTGVHGTHEALRDNYLGEYGWFDPITNTQEPTDDNGHGTHCTGTICGTGGIGVFPNAKWMGCKGCSGSCPSSALLQCAQYVICPTLPDGSNKDCSKRAHVSSNSWNGGQAQTWYDPAIEAYHAAFVIPVFSNGNTGPMCGSSMSPADRDVIAVGASTSEDSIAYFSSVGPAIGGALKPDLSAPGDLITSSWASSDSSYATASGTSMACPHVSGLVALLLAYNPNLTFSKIRNYLIQGSDTDTLFTPGPVCGGTPNDAFPNNIFGHGRINALASLELLVADNAPPTQEPTTEEPEVTTEVATTEEPVATTEVDVETTTEAAEPEPEPSGCTHGPVWYPDQEGEPTLVCICQQEREDNSFFYKCISGASG